MVRVILSIDLRVLCVMLYDMLDEDGWTALLLLCLALLFLLQG